MTLARRILYGVGALLTLAVLLLAWLAATESGTRWLLTRAAGMLPSQLTLSEAGGTLLQGVEFARIDWQDDTVSVAARDVEIRVRLLPLVSRRVYVDRLRSAAAVVDLAERETAADAGGGLPTISLPVFLRLQDTELRALDINAGERSERIELLRLRAEMNGAQLEVEQFELVSDNVRLAADGRARLRGNYPGRLNLDWRWLEAGIVPGVDEFAGRLSLDGDASNAELRHQLATPAEIETSGRVTFIDNELSLDLNNRWAAIVWPTKLGPLELRDGSLHVAGEPTDLGLGLETAATLGDYPPTLLQLNSQLQPDRLRIESLHAASDYGELAASGEVSWRETPTALLEFALSGVDPARWLPYTSGNVGARGVAAAAFGEAGPSIELSIANLDGSVNGHPLGGRATVDVASGTTRISDAELTLGSNRMSVAATFAESQKIDLEFDLPALSELRPDARGAAEGRVFVRDLRELRELRASLQGTGLAWNTLAIERLQADVDFGRQTAGSARVVANAVTAGNSRIDALTVSATGRVNDHSLEASITNLGQTLEIAAASGSWSGDAWQAQLRRAALSGDAVGRWQGSDNAGLRVSRDGVSLERFCVRGPNAEERVCVAGSYSGDGEADVDAQLSGLPLAALPLRLPTGVDAHGVIDARFQGQLRERRISGDASLQLEDGSISSEVDGETIAVVIDDARGSVELRDNRMRATASIALADGAGDAGLELRLDDLLDSRSAIAGRGELRISDAALFAVLIPQVTNPRGRIGGSLDIGGNLPAPAFTGEITLDDGAFGVRPAGIEVVDVSARLAQLSPGQLQLDGRARSNEGDIRVQGRTTVSAETGIRSELAVDGSNFELARLPDWRVTASPDIELVFDERRTTVRGSLTIPSADIRLREVPRTAVAPSADVTVHRPEGNETVVRRRVEVAVRTELGDNVNFAGFGLTTGLEGSIDIEGGTHAPWTGRGRLGLRDGRYVAYGQELDIEHGELIFNGPLANPNLDIRAVRRTGDVTAGIQLAGTARQPRSSVYAEPAMSDADALSYLLTGRPMATATGEGEGSMLNSAAFALGLAGAGNIVSEIRGDLGLETLAVEGGGDDSRIVAGKRIGDRLLIEYGYGLIDKLGTLLLRYQINERLVLESRTGTVSNLDLVYRVRKR